MAATEQFSLRWNNFHSNLTSGFHELLESSEMVDVTLAVDGHFIQAHKIVLSICSPYFKQMFKVNPCKHPIVILRDVAHENMKDILEFMYMGEVNVLRENLATFLRTAELLQVKGLTGDDSSETSSRKDDKSESMPDDDQDMSTFDTDVDIPIHYSTPQVPIPAQKRSKLLNPLANIKRSKIEAVKAVKAEPETLDGTLTDCDGDETDMKPIIEQKESDETKDMKQIYENNFTNSGSTEGNLSDQEDKAASQKVYVYCPYCCRKFVNRYNLKVHMRDKHEDSALALDCPICGKVMRNQSCLRVHLYHHRKQQLECPVVPIT